MVRSHLAAGVARAWSALGGTEGLATVSAGSGNGAAVAVDREDFVQPAPAAFDGIEVVEQRGAEIPLDLTFRDETGASVLLSQYFADGLPVVLTFNYSTCPQLCSVQLNELTKTLAKSEYAPGWHYHVVTVILNPRESVTQIAETKQTYLDRLPETVRAHAAKGWHFLLGDEATIRRLAAAIGFGYKYLPEQGEYAHPALLTFLSSRGVVNRYLHGLTYEPAQYDQSVASAGNDTPQESAGFLHRCFAWDPDANNYSGMAHALMRYAAAGTIALLLAALGIWRLARAGSNKVTKESLP
jgi:protein SCO1/2